MRGGIFPANSGCCVLSHEELQDLIGVVTGISSKEVPEGKADPFLTVPFQTVQEVPDRMVAIPVCHDMKRFLNELQGTDTIGPLAVQILSNPV